MYARYVLLLACAICVQGCVLTKVVTVPMRVGGAVISIVPIAGNPVDNAIDRAADKIDDLPF